MCIRILRRYTIYTLRYAIGMQRTDNLVSDLEDSDNGDPLRDYFLPLSVIHGLVTVSTPGPVRNSYSVRLLGQNYRNRNQNKVRDYVLTNFIHSSINPTMAAPRS